MKACTVEGRLLVAFWRFGAFPVVACVFVAAIVACHRPSNTAEDISVEETIGPAPLRSGDAKVTIQLADRLAKPVTLAKIAVEGVMSHPGMKPIFGTGSEVSPGIYVAHLDFDMAGDWVVLSHIVLADGRKLERQMYVRITESNR